MGEGVEGAEIDFLEATSSVFPCPLSPGSGVGVLDGSNPSFSRFFCFIRLFWNQIFTWVSFNCKAAAISTRRALVKYLLKWNSFSSSVSCLVVKLVRTVFGCPPKPYSPDLPMGWDRDGHEFNNYHIRQGYLFWLHCVLNFTRTHIFGRQPVEVGTFYAPALDWYCFLPDKWSHPLQYYSDIY